MGKTIMILGAGTFQVPAITKANELGYRTVALSYYPDDPGMKLASKSYVCSTTEKEDVLVIARREHIDGIMTIASEVAAITAAYVAEHMGLPGYKYDIARTICNKYKLRKFLAQRAIETPEFGLARNFEEAKGLFSKLSKPVFIKPATASGSSGVFKLDSLDQLEAAFNSSLEASIVDKEVIIEEFIEGVEVGGEILVKDRKISFFAATKKYLNQAHVPYGHLLPCDISEGETNEIKSLLKRVIKGLELDNGPLNFDIMITDRGPVIIELGGRLGGNCLPQLMHYHTGNDTIKRVIEIATGNSVKEVQNNHREPVAAYIMGSRRSGLVKAVKQFEDVFPQYAKNLIFRNTNCQPGDSVSEFTKGSHQIGYIIIKDDSADKLMEMINEIHRINWIEIA